MLALLGPLSACGDRSVADRDALATRRPSKGTAPAKLANGRIRYDPRHSPVLVAPDGSRHTVTSLLAVPHRMAFGEFVWRDLVAPGAPVWVAVDLSRQLISVFRGGDEIGTAVVIFGTNGKRTPTGVYHVRGKERLHRSAAYDAEMPFTLWLTADGVAIHASSIERGRATHGCIGVPEKFASQLFAAASVGSVVIVSPTKQS